MSKLRYVIGLLCVTTTLQATPPNPIYDFYKQALIKSEVIRIQESKVGQAQARLDQVRGLTFTQLSFQGSETIQDNSAVGSGAISPFTAQYKPEFKLAVTQPLFSGFRDQEIQASLHSEVLAQQLSLESQKQQLFSQIAMQYFDILFSQKELETASQTLQILNDRTEEIVRRVNLGKSRRNELSSVQAEWLDISATIVDIKGQLEAKRLQFARLIGAPVSTFFQDVLVATQNSDITEDQYKQIIANRREIKVIDAQIVSQKHQLQAAKLTNMPTVDLAGNYYLQRTASLDPIKWDATLRLTIPFLEGGQQESKIKESLAIVSQFEQQKHELETVLETALRIAVLQATTAIQVSKTKEKAYAKAKEAYADLIADYRLGLANHLDVLQYLNNLMQIKKNRDVSAIYVQRSSITLQIEKGELPL